MEHTNNFLTYRPPYCQKLTIAKGGGISYSRFCSLPCYSFSLHTPKNTHKHLHTPWPTTAIIPVVFPWYPFCDDYEYAGDSVSVVNSMMGVSWSGLPLLRQRYGICDAAEESLTMSGGGEGGGALALAWQGRGGNIRFRHHPPLSPTA